MKGIIHQEEISTLNIYAPNIGAPIYIKITLMAPRAQVDPNTVIVGDLNTPLSQISKSSDERLTKKLQSYSTH
jgi:hypothetical protein